MFPKQNKCYFYKKEVNSMESNRESILKKGYMKVFALSIFLLITGIIIISIGNLLATFADPKTSGE